MKKATAAILLLIMLSVFPLAGCETGNVDKTPEPTDPNTAFVTEKPTEAPTEEPTAEPTAEPTEPPFVYPSVAPLEIHVYSMDDLVYGTIVSFNPIYFDYCADGDIGWNSIITFKQRMEYGGCIPAFREAGDFEYAVFDTDAGYRMFIQIQDRPSRGKTLVGSPILIKDVHSYSDFESLKIGDPIEAVAEIDPVAGVIKKAGEIHQLTRDWLKAAVRLYGWPTSLHYLTDGVLRIEYNVDENGGMYIRSIKYSEDYVIQSAVDTSTYVNYRLIPCDLPPAWQEVMGG